MPCDGCLSCRYNVGVGTALDYLTLLHSTISQCCTRLSAHISLANCTVCLSWLCTTPVPFHTFILNTVRHLHCGKTLSMQLLASIFNSHNLNNFPFIAISIFVSQIRAIRTFYYLNQSYTWKKKKNSASKETYKNCIQCSSCNFLLEFSLLVCSYTFLFRSTSVTTFLPFGKIKWYTVNK